MNLTSQQPNVNEYRHDTHSDVVSGFGSGIFHLVLKQWLIIMTELAVLSFVEDRGGLHTSSRNLYDTTAHVAALMADRCC